MERLWRVEDFMNGITNPIIKDSAAFDQIEPLKAQFSSGVIKHIDTPVIIKIQNLASKRSLIKFSFLKGIGWIVITLDPIPIPPY